MNTYFSGFVQGCFNKKFVDQLQIAVNSNAGKITSNGKGKGFNTTTQTKLLDTGSLNVMHIYDTNGQNITYTDVLNNTYYLCAEYTVESAVPQPVNPGNTMVFVANNLITITLFGQYFGLGTPPPSSNKRGNVYQLWTILSDGKNVPIGNPTFTFNTRKSLAQSPESVSFFLNSIDNNGIYIATPASKPIKSLCQHYVVNNEIIQYNLTCQLELGYGDLSTTNTNIFTNSSNTSKTFKNLSSVSPNTTFYNDYHIHNTSPQNSACYLVFSVQQNE